MSLKILLNFLTYRYKKHRRNVTPKKVICQNIFQTVKEMGKLPLFFTSIVNNFLISNFLKKKGFSFLVLQVKFCEDKVWGYYLSTF